MMRARREPFNLSELARPEQRVKEVVEERLEQLSRVLDLGIGADRGRLAVPEGTEQ